MTQSVAHQARLDTVEAAKYVGLGKSTLNKLRVFGGGPAFIKYGKRVVYDTADLDAWCDRNKRTSTSEAIAA